MPKTYRIIWHGEEVFTSIPGKYAGSRNDRIFGRLDCPSGLQKLHKENRVFFHDWEDAVQKGYRPCKVCHPEIPRLDERLSNLHPILWSMHVAIFKTGPCPYPKKPGVSFYVTLLLNERREKDSGLITTSQIDLETWFPYPTAIKKAIAWGKILGLPVIDHFILADKLVRYAESTPPTPEQLRAREGLFRFRHKKSMTSDMFGRITK